MCQKRAQRSLLPAPSSTRSAAGNEPTLPRTKHPCTSSILRCRCGNITATKPTTTLAPVHMAGRSGPTTATNQEQQLCMRCWPAPAPSPPRFATAREDVEARRGAGPPCTFRYARPILNHRQQAKNHHQKGKAGDSGCSVRLYPPRGSPEEGHAAHCTTTRCYHRARFTLHIPFVDSVAVQHQRIGYGVRHAVRTTTDDLPVYMLFSPTRPVTPESSWVPGRLPRPTGHPISFFFPSPYTQVLLYGNKKFFLHCTHKCCSMVVGLFSLRRIHKYSLFRPLFFHFPPWLTC